MVTFSFDRGVVMWWRILYVIEVIRKVMMMMTMLDDTIQHSGTDADS